LIKNSQTFGKKCQKTAGGIFLTHTVCPAAISINDVVSQRSSSLYILHSFTDLLCISSIGWR